MISTWLLHWNIEQEKPFVEFSRNEETISFAHFPDNGQSFALFEGFLFDKHNFRAGQRASDADRVAEYYDLYGEDMFLKLRGAYSLVIWDAERHNLIAGRDNMGQVPFYYFWDDKSILISSDMRTLLNQPEINATFNRVMVAEHLQFVWNDYQSTETYFEDIHRLPPAYYLRIFHGQLSRNRYWDPLPTGFHWATKEEIKYFPDLFEQAVNRCLLAGADSIALSGGFDSTSIAVMANKINQRNGRPPIHAISSMVANTGADDGKIQLAVARALNMPQIAHYLDEWVGKGSGFQTLLDKSSMCPFPNSNFLEFFFSGLMEIAAKHNLNKMMMGTGGDELFFVDGSWAYELVKKLKFKKYLDYYRTRAEYFGYSRKRAAYIILWKRTLKPIAMSLAMGNLGRLFEKNSRFFRADRGLIPSWISDEDKDLLEALKFRLENSLPVEFIEGESKYVQAIQQTPQSSVLMFNIEHRFFHSRHIGFSNLYPFFDFDLMSLAFRMNPEELIKDGLIKAPLQHFLHKNLPSIQLPRTKTDYSQTPNDLLRTKGKKAWIALEGVRSLEKIGIINRTILDEIIEDYFSLKNNQWSPVWQVISTEAWLRDYEKTFMEEINDKENKSYPCFSRELPN